MTKALLGNLAFLHLVMVLSMIYKWRKITIPHTTSFCKNPLSPRHFFTPSIFHTHSPIKSKILPPLPKNIIRILRTSHSFITLSLENLPTFPGWHLPVFDFLQDFPLDWSGSLTRVEKWKNLTMRVVFSGHINFVCACYCQKVFHKKYRRHMLCKLRWF